MKRPLLILTVLFALFTQLRASEQFPQFGKVLPDGRQAVFHLRPGLSRGETFDEADGAPQSPSFANSSRSSTPPPASGLRRRPSLSRKGTFDWSNREREDILNEAFRNDEPSTAQSQKNAVPAGAPNLEAAEEKLGELCDLLSGLQAMLEQRDQTSKDSPPPVSLVTRQPLWQDPASSAPSCFCCDCPLRFELKKCRDCCDAMAMLTGYMCFTAAAIATITWRSQNHCTPWPG